MVIKITSTVFDEGGVIPNIYSCNGINISPPLNWDDFPEDTVSIALICEDPDRLGGLWTHWIIFNIPADARDLPEHVMGREELNNGARHGLNDFGSVGYGGAVPTLRNPSILF